MLRPCREELRRTLRGTPFEIVRELAVEREVRIAADGRREMGVVALREPEVADRRRVVDGALHRPQDHRRERRIERVSPDRLEKLREDVRVRYVPGLYPESLQLCAEHVELLVVRRLVEAREDSDSLGPEFLRDRLVRGDHALLYHLVRFVVGASDKARHLPVRVEQYLGLGDFDVKRTRGEALCAHLLRERGYLAYRLRLAAADPRGRCAADDGHHLFVGEPRLRADYRLREGALDDLAVPVEREEDRERKTVLVRHERADAVRELLGKHRHDPVAEIYARRAAVRLAVKRAPGLDVVRNVGDVYAENAVAPAVCLERERVVVVACRLGVAREYELAPQVEPPGALYLPVRKRPRRNVPGLGEHRRGKRLRQLVELHHRRGVFLRRLPGRGKHRPFYDVISLHNV